MPSFTPSAITGGVPTVPSLNEGEAVRTFSAVIQRCADTGLLVGYVPGFPGAHSQGETLEELQVNLQEVITMLLEDGEPAMESDFVGLQQIVLPA
jgi:predicted RNase H-like HicB family nuclease